MSYETYRRRWIERLVLVLVFIVIAWALPRTASGESCGADETTHPPAAPELTLLVSHGVLRDHTTWMKNSVKHTLSEYQTPGMCPVEGGGNGPACSPNPDHGGCGADQVCASGYHPWATCPEDAGPVEQDDRPRNANPTDPVEGPSTANDSVDTGEQGPCYCWADSGSEPSCSSSADCSAGHMCVEGACRCRDFNWGGCDPLRVGLTTFDESGCQANSDEFTNHMVAEMEEEETGGASRVISVLDKVKSAGSGGDFCRSATEYRPLDDALVEHQTEEKFPSDPQVTERMWERPHVNLLFIGALPQTSDTQPDGRVARSLDTVCRMLEGDDGSGSGRVPPLVTYVMHDSGRGGQCLVDDQPVDVFAGMLAAAGGTGSCCFDGNADGDCDDGTDASRSQIGDAPSFCSHVRGLSDATLRRRIDPGDAAAGTYRCLVRRQTDDRGSIPFCKKPGLDCQLAGNDNVGGTNCGDSTVVGRTDVLAAITCLRTLPKGKDFDDVAIRVCEDADESDDCRRLTEDDVVFLDPNRRTFRIKRTVGVDGVSVCSGRFDGAIQIDPCPDEGSLCTAPSGCTAGVVRCVDGQQECVVPDGVSPSNPETCDGKDNDCDGVIDEDADVACDTGRSGRCRGGVRHCSDGSLGSCEPLRRAVPEICNGLDDDCNGVPDDIGRSMERNWSISDLATDYSDALCGGVSRCVCPEASDPDGQHRAGQASGGLAAEFDAMVQQTRSGCYCSGD